MPPRRTEVVTAPAIEPEPLDEEDIEEEEAAPVVVYKRGKYPIERQTLNTWWCPVDDTSMPQGNPTGLKCPTCGGVRQMNTLVVR